MGAFELKDPVPELRQPHLILALRPWIDVGSVGSGALNTLEKYLDARELGRLRRPSSFYDLTRYRPQLYRVDGERRVEIPNTVLRYATGLGSHDFVFLHALEPHLNGEDYLDSLLEVVEFLRVSRYCQVGAMYGSMPHTRPLSVTGNASEEEVQQQLEGLLAVRQSTYEGPTSIMALLTEELRQRKINTMGMLVQLPPYVQLEEDSKGQETLLRLLDVLYEFRLDLSDLQHQGNKQYRELDRAVQADPQIRAMVRRLEETYDAGTAGAESSQEGNSLSPEVEQFLTDLEHDQDSG